MFSNGDDNKINVGDLVGINPDFKPINFSLENRVGLVIGINETQPWLKLLEINEVSEYSNRILLDDKIMYFRTKDLFLILRGCNNQ